MHPLIVARKLFGLAAVRFVLAAIVALLLTMPQARADAPVRDFHARDAHVIHELKLGILGHASGLFTGRHETQRGVDVNVDVTFAAAGFRAWLTVASG